MSSDPEQSGVKLTQPDDDDDACGKLWEIYANEAKEYDEGLVKSWREDMDVVLVFSGLYSAILTAFVIESYQKLEENPADVSAQLLKAIYLQQVSSPDVLNSTQPWNDTFTPTPTALACNVLWFISLSLALICAFLAMFIQQWSRHFIHRISIARSPTTRARLIQFFYFGLKEHRMHILVDVIPYLLHLSLFYFFAGLAAFLWTVHRPLASLILALLASLVGVYAIITLLPIVRLNSPYQTPISSLIWRIRQITLSTFTLISPRRRGPPLDTGDPETGGCRSSEPASANRAHNSSFSHRGKEFATEKLNLLQAMVHSGRRRQEDREAQSITWTLKSLSDGKDILALIEALPAVLENNRGFRLDNLHLIRPILETTAPHCNVLTRAYSLLVSAENTWHTVNYRERCRSSVSTFLWALSRALLSHPKEFMIHHELQLTYSKATIIPKEMIVALRTQVPVHQSARGYTLSIMVLCMLHNCLTLGEATSSDPQTLSDLIETGEAIFGHYSSNGRHDLCDVGWHMKSTDHRRMNRNDITSHLFWTYLQVAGIHFPAGFTDVCNIFHQKNIRPLHPDQGIGEGLLVGLTFQLYQLDGKQEVMPNTLDSIFMATLRYTVVKDLPAISSYVLRRAQLGQWTATEWKEEDLSHLCNLLMEPLPGRYMSSSWADVSKWIIAHMHNNSRIVYGQFFSLTNHLVGRHDIESEPSLAFFVKLSIIKKYSYVNGDAFSETYKSVVAKLASDGRFTHLLLDLDPTDLAPYTDVRFGSSITPHKEEICSGERGINGSILLIQALVANTPVSECRHILEFFYRLHFPVDSVAFLAREPSLLKQLVKITQKFSTLWISSPSHDLLEIHLMVWRLWSCILTEGPWKDPNPWRDLNPRRRGSRDSRRDWRDPGPWGDPDPWNDPDQSCISELHPLLDAASVIMSVAPETLQKLARRASWSTVIDNYDIVSEVENVNNRVVGLLARGLQSNTLEQLAIPS